MYNNQAITITFGDCAENHVGMQQIGELSANGYTYTDLENFKLNFNSSPSEIFNLKDLAGLTDNSDVPDAFVLIVKNGTDELLNETGFNKVDLFNEQINLNYDKHAYMYGRVVNKNARWNICFSNFSQEPDYSNKKGRIVDFSSGLIPLTKLVKNKLENISGAINEQFELQGEGNYYYDTNKTGIGFHGDAERKKIIAVKLGSIIPFEYQWFYKGKPVGNRIHFDVGDGDIYMMDTIASGFNWKRKNIYTLRHAAGCEKFLKI